MSDKNTQRAKSPAASKEPSIDEEEVFLPPDPSALSRLPGRIQKGIKNIYEERLHSYRGTAKNAIKTAKPTVMTDLERRRRGGSTVARPKTSLETQLDEDVDFWENQRKRIELEEAQRFSKFNLRRSNASPAPSIESMKLQERAREWRADEARKSLEKKIEAERRGIPAQPWTSWPPPGYDKWGQPITDEKDSWAFRDDSFQAQKESEEKRSAETKTTRNQNSDEIVPMAHWQSEAARIGMSKGDLTTADQSAPDHASVDSLTSAQGIHPSNSVIHKKTLGRSIKDRVRKLLGRSRRGSSRGKVSKDTKSYPSLKSVLQESDPEISFASSGSLLATKGTRHSQKPSISRSQNNSPISNQTARGSAKNGMTFRGRVEQYN